MKKRLKIIDPDGLHARPVSFIVKIANKFPDDCFIHYSGKKATLKSILFVMSLGIPTQAEVDLEIIGENEETIANQIVTVLKEQKVI
jgi:phosphocarrier protein